MFCDGPEAFVSTDVPPAVANGLQVVQVDRKDRKGILISVRIHRDLIEHQVELESVCEAGCRVRQGRAFVRIGGLFGQRYRCLRSDYFQTSKRLFIELFIASSVERDGTKDFPIAVDWGNRRDLKRWARIAAIQ